MRGSARGTTTGARGASARIWLAVPSPEILAYGWRRSPGLLRTASDCSGLRPGKATGRNMRWNAYIASVFGKCGKLLEYLRTGIMPERESYPWAA